MPAGAAPSKLRTHRLSVHYGDFPALKEVSASIGERRLTALVGPSGCGKSTLLRVFNRMNDLIPGCRTSGVAELDGLSLYGSAVEVEALRRRVGMVFQRPNPFPLTIRENVLYGLRIHSRTRGVDLDEVIERCLGAVGLWDELRDRLQESALAISSEQAQRLCIARAIAVQPEVLLMDEPCSALDPIATARIESLMRELVRSYTILVVTHNLQQAARISDDTGFLLLGELVEMGETAELFTRPRDQRTEDYVTGRYG
ncbi:MAG TPA: phosphate ABC transporter ATP-binding protein [Polyangiaceae bacterium]|nr:phosphate ABC transporter ATP-binding protein [Polyangiaceae bacterium]